MKTTIVNLYGGPGSGKSTLAAGVFYRMKTLLYSVELAYEHAKRLAYRKHGIGKWDEVYIFAKQLHIESAMYGLVDWIITDRPVGMSSVYARHIGDKTGVADAVEACLAEQARSDIRHVNLMVKRCHPYVPAGRFHSETEALEIDRLCRLYKPGMVEVSSVEDVLEALKVY